MGGLPAACLDRDAVGAKAVCGGVDTRRVLTGRAIDSVATSQERFAADLGGWIPIDAALLENSGKTIFLRGKL